MIEIPDVRPEQRGGLGTAAVNGGILAAVFDFAVGCTSVLAPPLRRSATVQLNIQFERAVRGSRLRCEAVIDRAASNLLFVSARLTDGEGLVCAKCSGIVSLGKAVTLDEWARELAAQT